MKNNVTKIESTENNSFEEIQKEIESLPIRKAIDILKVEFDKFSSKEYVSTSWLNMALLLLDKIEERKIVIQKNISRYHREYQKYLEILEEISDFLKSKLEWMRKTLPDGHGDYNYANVQRSLFDYKRLFDKNFPSIENLEILSVARKHYLKAEELSGDPFQQY